MKKKTYIIKKDNWLYVTDNSLLKICKDFKLSYDSVAYTLKKHKKYPYRAATSKISVTKLHNDTNYVAICDRPLETNTTDITGTIIKLNDQITAFDHTTFKVIFEQNAFRKQYPDCDNSQQKPILETTSEAKKNGYEIS